MMNSISISKFCIKSIIVFFLLVLSLQITKWEENKEFEMTEEELLWLSLDYSITIWCMKKNLETYIPKLNSKNNMICNWKKMILPKKEDLKIFIDKYFDIKETQTWVKKVCWESCLQKLANRFSIINFESWFNPDLISKTHDYWYIQLHKQPEYLWKVKESLDVLDQRFENHKTTVCQNKYNVDVNDHVQMFKCLAMRHNWQRSIESYYSKRAYEWSEFYKEWFKNKYSNHL